MREEPLPLKFVIGLAQIAALLKLSESQVEKMLQAGELPAKKDTLGRLVLCNLDYYRSQEEEKRTRK